jgi:hypothetical protein
MAVKARGRRADGEVRSIRALMPHGRFETAREHLEEIRWAHGVHCPHCGGMENVRELGGAAADIRFRRRVLALACSLVFAKGITI